MTLLTAVVGHPLSHTLSPLLHNSVYSHEHIDAHMDAYDEKDIASFVRFMREKPIHFAAVTLPYKQTVMPLLDAVHEEAEKIGSVNTVINREGQLIGYNTDIVGIEAALCDVSLSGARVLIIGAGGAAQPLAYFLQKQNAEWYCMSRTESNAAALCARFGGTVLTELIDQSFELVINATPLGLKPDDALPCPETLLQPGVTVFDLIYISTRMQKVAGENGARVITGVPMFIAQGLEQERLWLGRKIRDSGYSALLQDHLQKTTPTL